MLSLGKLLLVVALNVLGTLCYIPAVPTNDTQKAITAGLNVTDISKLNLHWFSNGFILYTSYLAHKIVLRKNSAVLTPRVCLFSWQVTGVPA